MELADEAPVKKGKRSWRPASYLDVSDKDDGFRYRWVLNDPQEVRRRLAEGLSFVNETTRIPGNREFEGQAENELTSIREVRELVLMAIPEEDAQARDEWVREQTRKQTISLREDAEARAKDALGPAATLYGRTVIE